MTAGLVAGVHTGLVDVSTPDAGGATQSVTIAMIVAPMTGPLLVEPTLLTNAALIGETPVAQYFAVFTTSSIPIAYTVTAPDTDEWLAPEPVSGILTNAQQTDTVAVVYATQYLDAGVYTSAIEIATAAGGGATQIVTVIMTVFDRVLPAPEGVTASQGAFTDRVRIQWLSVDNAERYTIWRHTSDSTNDATQIGTVDSSLGVRSTLAFDDPGAASGIRYYYWVRAHNSAGPGPLSLAAQGWRGLEAPAAITASQGDYHDRIALEWSAVAGATTYEVWRGLTPEIDSASRLATTSSTTLDDGNLAAPTHYYWARSGNAMGFGPFSQAAKGWRRATGPGDFSGNGKADAWYYYQAYGMWYIVPSEGDPYNIRFGWWETEATPGDYDGDGRLNLGVYHRAAGIWYLALNSGLYACLFGHPEADPVPADYDGDGITDLGVYFPAYGAWYVLRLDGTLLAWNSIWGGPGLRAVRGDFDGDRKEDLAVYDQRNGCWYVTGLDGTLLVWAFPFGFQGAEPISGDFDGDKRTDFCVYYPAAGMWYIYTWQGEFRSVAWGWAEARPVAADFDGDGVDDIAVFHHDRFDARWYLLQSKDGYRMISSRENR